MHQIVCIGDLHLRSTGDREPARRQALDQIVREGCELPNLGAWLQFGDIFDSRSTTEDRNVLSAYLIAMASRAPVVIVLGNHEAPNDADILGKLSARWPIHVVTGPQVLPVQLATGHTAACACLPYPHRAGLIAAGAVKSDVLQVGARALADVCRGLAMELRDWQERGALPIFAGHVNVEGSILSNGQASIGVELSIDAEMLRLFGDVPKILGHIHFPQTIAGAYYAGSIAPCNWGEVEKKRYLVVEFEEAA